MIGAGGRRAAGDDARRRAGQGRLAAHPALEAAVQEMFGLTLVEIHGTAVLAEGEDGAVEAECVLLDA